MNKDVIKELAIKATDIVLKANDSTGELGFNTAYIQEQWRYEFAKLVEQATLERAAKVCDELQDDWRIDDCGNPESGPRECAISIRALKDSNDEPR